ncbi:MAG: hypothetical protein QW052_06220 [Candidatus Nitrosocaldaceae archaeon]
MDIREKIEEVKGKIEELIKLWKEVKEMIEKVSKVDRDIVFAIDENISELRKRYDMLDKLRKIIIEHGLIG